MYKVGEYIVYKKDVCKIIGIKEKYFNNNDYYTLIPIDDKTLHLEIPINNKFLRDLIKQSDVEKIISKIPEIEIIKSDDKLLEHEYKSLINNGTHEDLIKIIKTTYLRNKERIDSKRKISDKDNHYFELAEKYLYNEFSIILNMDYEETKKYVIDMVNTIENSKI